MLRRSWWYRNFIPTLNLVADVLDMGNRQLPVDNKMATVAYLSANNFVSPMVCSYHVVCLQHEEDEYHGHPSFGYSGE